LQAVLADAAAVGVHGHAGFTSIWQGGRPVRTRDGRRRRSVAHSSRWDWRCMLVETSPENASYRWASRSTLVANRLYAHTGGIAANRPIAVAISASEMPGATLAMVASLTLARPWNEIMIPHTVPNRPT